MDDCVGRCCKIAVERPLFTARRTRGAYFIARYAMARSVSVCLFATTRCSVKMAEWIEPIFGTEVTLGLCYTACGKTSWACTKISLLQTPNLGCFCSTVCKTVRPVLWGRYLSCLSVCYIGVLWSNGWMDQDATWYGYKPRPRPHCVRWGPSSTNGKGHSSTLLFGP